MILVKKLDGRLTCRLWERYIQLVGSHWRSGRQQVVGRIGIADYRASYCVQTIVGTLSAILCEYRFKTTTLSDFRSS